jgi:patatin-like phospholipase/acyl hydrolase
MNYHLGLHRPHQSRRKQFFVPYYDNFGENFMPLTHWHNYHPAYRRRGSESSSDIELPSSVEDATRAHVEATIDFEKAKEKFEEAKKKFEDCEKKMKEAKKKLQMAKQTDNMGWW